MENREYIRYASQAVEKAKQAGFNLTNKDFTPCRIYPLDGRNYGYVALVAEVEKEGEAYYLYVKAYSGQTPRQAILVHKDGTKIQKFGLGHNWKAVGKTEWAYKAMENGDYEIVSEYELQDRRRQAAAQKVSEVKD